MGAVDGGLGLDLVEDGLCSWGHFLGVGEIVDYVIFVYPMCACERVCDVKLGCFREAGLLVQKKKSRRRGFFDLMR